MRKVYLDELPHMKNNISKKINWKACFNYSVNFVYDDTEGVLQVKDYDSKNHKINVEYINQIFSIHTDKLINNNISIILNSIWNKASWMIDLLQNKEDAIKYTFCSEKRINFICPYCGAIINKCVKDVYIRHKVICTCSDSLSYPEKFIYCCLSQLSSNFTYQLTSKYYNWCNKYKYDFYINDKSCIIETHGIQHYEENTLTKQTLYEIQENDMLKEQLAKANSIEYYIILDCRYSELKWIKKSVLESELPTLFNFTEDDIDWLKCEEYALKNLVKEVCDIKKDNQFLTTSDIGSKVGISRKTVKEYLKKGSKLGWCNYNPKEEHLMVASMTTNKNNKKVEVFKNNKSLGTYTSGSELERKSEELFGVKLSQTRISHYCLGRNKIPNYKGFTFKYVTE